MTLVVVHFSNMTTIPNTPSKATVGFLKKNRVTVIQWPSPDLNPIERLWGNLASRYGDVTTSRLRQLHLWLKGYCLTKSIPFVDNFTVLQLNRPSLFKRANRAKPFSTDIKMSVLNGFYFSAVVCLFL